MRSYWTTSLLPENTRHTPHLLVYKNMLSHFSALIGAEAGAAEEEIWRRRTAAYSSDRNGYIRRLFADARIEAVFIDVGYPTMKLSGYDVTPKLFSSLLPVPVKVIVRIEPIIMEIAERKLPFSEFVDEFVSSVEKKIGENDTVALKTAAAYFTGLEVLRFSPADIKRSFEGYRKNPSLMESARPFFNHLVHIALGIARRHDLPMQVHTGFGNAPLLDLAASNPVLLFSLLADEEFRKTPIILLHSGYPYVREAAYLANNYPNVYVDISQVSQYVGVGLPAVLTELLSLAPVNKIMYGSDGLGCPELFWWPAKNVKASLGRVLDHLISDGQIAAHDAEEIASRILSRNATELYLQRHP
jgi:predicted TIM-barrel fold metal-dependent hydrolase